MIRDLNLVLSPKYPGISTASVTAGLATNAHGHNCPTQETFSSLDLKTTTTRLALRVPVWPVVHPRQDGSDTGLEFPPALQRLRSSTH